MQAVKDSIKFTSASTPKKNTTKTVKASATKSNKVEFVEADKPKTNQKSEKNTKQNTTFQNMLTKTSTQTKPVSQKKTGSTSRQKTSTTKSSSTTTKTSTAKPSSATGKNNTAKLSSTTTKTNTTKPNNNTSESNTSKTNNNTTNSVIMVDTEEKKVYPTEVGVVTDSSTTTKSNATKETNATTQPSSTTIPHRSQYSVQFVFPTQMFHTTQTVTPVEGTTQTQQTTLESMLKEKYPNLKYHVFDGSSSYWRTRNDYPHYLLYQDNIDTKALENWKPSGENPFYGSIDGVFTAPKEIKALSSVPVGSMAVVIHPKVQERMENDPEYAKEIYDRITKWFEFDKTRNEAIMPGINARSSWSVAIGENGEIVNAQSHSSGGGFTESQSGSDAAVDFWTKRNARHQYFMQLQLEGQLRHEMLLYGLTGTPKSYGLFDLAGGTLNASTLSGLMKLTQNYEMPVLSSQQLEEKAKAKAKLTAMLNSGELNILGDTVIDMPLENLIALTKQEVSRNNSFY